MPITNILQSYWQLNFKNKCFVYSNSFIIHTWLWRFKATSKHITGFWWKWKYRHLSCITCKNYILNLFHYSSRHQNLHTNLRGTLALRSVQADVVWRIHATEQNTEVQHCFDLVHFNQQQERNARSKYTSNSVTTVAGRGVLVIQQTPSHSRSQKTTDPKQLKRFGALCHTHQTLKLIREK